MKSYIIVEFNANRKKYSFLGEFDTRKEAEKRCEEFFFTEFYDSDYPEDYSDYVDVRLADGRQISYDDFWGKDEFAGIEDYEYVFTGKHNKRYSWEHDGRYYSVYSSGMEEEIKG